jgi:hypothetical protein
MLAGDGVEFLYTAVSRCKVPPGHLSIYIVILEVRACRRRSPRAIQRSGRALTFFARERGPVNRRSKKFEFRLIRCHPTE